MTALAIVAGLGLVGIVALCVICREGLRDDPLGFVLFCIIIPLWALAAILKSTAEFLVQRGGAP